MYLYGPVLVLLVLSVQAAYPQEALEIRASQETYHYGDPLTFTVRVADVLDRHATLYITDERGKSSSPIPLAIEQRETTLTSPFPFGRETYPEGAYTLKILYAGMEAETGFVLEDSGRVVIPLWIKDVGRLWVGGGISDQTFLSAVEFLINENIIVIPHAEAGEPGREAGIPTWVKSNAEWWIQGHITDGEFAAGLQYLIRAGIIVV